MNATRATPRGGWGDAGTCCGVIIAGRSGVEREREREREGGGGVESTTCYSVTNVLGHDGERLAAPDRTG